MFSQDVKGAVFNSKKSFGSIYLLFIWGVGLWDTVVVLMGYSWQCSGGHIQYQGFEPEPWLQRPHISQVLYLLCYLSGHIPWYWEDHVLLEIKLSIRCATWAISLNLFTLQQINLKYRLFTYSYHKRFYLTYYIIIVYIISYILYVYALF